MLKKTFTYIDSNNVEQIEDIYFNLTLGELYTATEISKTITTVDPLTEDDFRQIVTVSCGMKSADGQFLIKSKDCTKEFLESTACVNFVRDLATDKNLAARFIQNILPKNLERKIR